ncbi:hypothetical protein A3Q56_08267, partial [Intoshia linei]
IPSIIGLNCTSEIPLNIGTQFNQILFSFEEFKQNFQIDAIQQNVILSYQAVHREFRSM